jgi:hypothetical protein
MAKTILIFLSIKTWCVAPNPWVEGRKTTKSVKPQVRGKNTIVYSCHHGLENFNLYHPQNHIKHCSGKNKENVGLGG